MARHVMPLDEITLAHGAGGLMSQVLIEFLTRNVKNRRVLDGVGLDDMDDGATIPLDGTRDVVVVSTDGHTVDPLFFPGGDLGKLAACGTINDLLVMGAAPVAITQAVFIEEGFPVDDLKRINDSFIATINEAGVALVAGDTKVMPRGTLNGCISATTGIGLATKGDVIVDAGVKPGDDIVVTGTLGDHGTALLACREGISFETTLRSDVMLLSDVVAIAKAHGARAMKDPTRGGLATALNEFAAKSSTSIHVDEIHIPFRRETISACEMLGLSPYELASEGRVLVAVPGGRGAGLVESVQRLEGCEGAAVIGTAREGHAGRVLVTTRVGGTRILATPLGEPVPRVC